MGLFNYGCVIIPLHERVVSGEKVHDESLSFIAIGVTSKTEISDRLRPPDYIWQDKNIFVYDWVERWGMLVEMFERQVTPTPSLYHQHILIIQFDSNDRVKRYGDTISDYLLNHSYGDHLINWVKQTEK